MREHDQPRFRTRHGVWIGLIIAVAISPALPAQVGRAPGRASRVRRIRSTCPPSGSSTGTGRASAGPCSRARPPCSRGPRGSRPLRRRPDRRDLASRHQGLSGSCLRRGGRPDHGAAQPPRELPSRGAHDPEGRPVVRLPEEWQRAAAGTARRTEDPRAVRPQAGRAGGGPPSAEVTSPAIAAGAASPPLPELEPVPERPPARRDPELKPARFVRQDPPQAREPAPEVDPPVAAPAPGQADGPPRIDLPPIEGEKDVVVPNLSNPDDVPAYPSPCPVRARISPRRRSAVQSRRR